MICLIPQTGLNVWLGVELRLLQYSSSCACCDGGGGLCEWPEGDCHTGGM